MIDRSQSKYSNPDLLLSLLLNYLISLDAIIYTSQVYGHYRHQGTRFRGVTTWNTTTIIYPMHPPLPHRLFFGTALGIAVWLLANKALWEIEDIIVPQTTKPDMS